MMLQTLPAEYADQGTTTERHEFARPRATDRRVESRIPIDEQAKVYVLRPTAGEVHFAVITDLSENGLGVRTENLLIPGSLILIRARRSILMVGRVRYSVKRDCYFQSGVQVEFAEDCRK
jgi:hypothetical protein